MGLKLKEDELNFEIEREREKVEEDEIEGWKRMYRSHTRASRAERERGGRGGVDDRL